MKKGFTLLEMLVVIGIIAVLMGAAAGAYTKMAKTADRAKCQELVANTATALTALFQDNGGVWPRALRARGGSDGELDADAALPLAKGGYMSLTMENNRLAGFDKFGIVTPWATAYIRRKGNAATLSGKVGVGTLRDHILHYALDLDGDGIIEGANVGGESINVRATAIVWCCGRDGKIEPYSKGLKKDDCYSWTKGQTVDVK